MVTTVVLLLVAVVLVNACLSLLQRRRHNSIGLTGSTIVSADEGRIGVPTLRRGSLGRVGRPDQLVRIGGQLIPVQQKPRAWHVQDSHVTLLPAECLLVSEVYGWGKAGSARSVGPVGVHMKGGAGCLSCSG